MVGYIYKYENNLNHKVYIGQTIHLVNRQQEHKSRSAYVKNKFYNAVRKYGWDNFNFQVIAEVSAESYKELVKLLDNLEIQYIQQYDSYNHGYNSTLGGGNGAGRIMPDSYIEYCKHRTYSEETRKKMSEASKKRLENPEWRKILTDQWEKMVAKRPPFKYSKKREDAIKKALCKEVIQLDEDCNVLKSFTSVKEATKYIQENYAVNRKLTGVEHGLYRHLKGITKKRLYYGFEWKFKTNV